MQPARNVQGSRNSLTSNHSSSYHIFAGGTLGVILFCVIYSSYLRQLMISTSTSILGCKNCAHRETGDVIKNLTRNLHENLLDQRIPRNALIDSVSFHLKNDNPRKPLVLSFHGWDEKEMLSAATEIVNAQFENGMSSRCAHKLYPNDLTTKYGAFNKISLENCVEDTASVCQHATFIFEDAHHLSEEVVNMLERYINPKMTPNTGYNYNRLIFVFITTVGANEITNIAHRKWSNSLKPEVIKLDDFQTVLKSIAFHPKNGVFKNWKPDSALVDGFVPFLPPEISNRLDFN